MKDIPKMGMRNLKKGLAFQMKEESLPISEVDSCLKTLQDNPNDIRNSTAYLQALSKEVQEHENVFQKLQSSASIISSVTVGLLVYQISDEVDCPSYTMTVVITSFLSLSCVLILSLCSFLTSKLSRVEKADFIDDTRNVKSFAVLSYLISLPLFLLSLLFKLNCYKDKDESINILLYICTPFIIFIVLIVGYILYEFDPQVFKFVILIFTTGPLAWYLLPDEFESFGRFKHHSSLKEQFYSRSTYNDIKKKNIEENFDIKKVGTIEE